MKIHRLLMPMILAILTVLSNSEIGFSEDYETTVMQDGGFHTIFLKNNGNPHSQLLDNRAEGIQLVSPQNGGQLDTLIPLFIWDVATGLGNSGIILAFSTTPNPSTPNMWTSATSGHWEEQVWYNLQPNTTYYWRIGIKFSNESIQWSDQWSFITGNSGGIILPAPTLISPINSTTISSNNVILKWNAVSGAEKYYVNLHNIDENTWYGWSEVSDTQLGYTSWCIKPGFHYEWYVTARNNYAWGTRSQYGEFNTKQTQSNISSMIHLLLN